MRVIVITGSRHLEPKEELREALRGADLVITGDQLGVDRTAYVVARELHIQVICAHAWWRQEGKAAGHIRNGDMAQLAVVFRALGHEVYAHAFPAVDSVGTYNCVKQLQELRIDGCMHAVPLHIPGGMQTALITGVKP